MGNQKQKWTQDEEDALIAGVEKHGPGKWKNILRDPEFSSSLTSRSNIDLKDKWRNLGVSNGTQGSKEKSRVPKIKAPAPATPAGNNSLAIVQHTTTPVATPVTPQAEPSSNVAAPDPSEIDSDAKNPPRYNAMVFEALSALEDANGSDLNAIATFIERKHKVPLNFRRALSTRLRRLVGQGKLEKVQNLYKITKDSSPGAKSPKSSPPPPPPPKQKDAGPQRQPPPPSGFVASSEMVKEAAEAAAYRIADAESKSYLAAKAVKEAERIALLAESSESMLQLAQQIYEQCSRGEVVMLAA